ncbi:hypothetical protein AB0L85_16080 [Streptomyces sp. NPDC052051]|uniref:hypothetical protein n=1 Tax=Streptomyces sp. NPDC052051 TaxID=3154649 RepID=UPI00343EF504
MSTQKTGLGAPPNGGAAAVRSGLGRTLSVVITLEALAVLVQAVTAGSFLNGDDAMKDVHATGATAVLVLALIQLVLAVLLWRPKRGPGWLPLAGLLLLVMTVAQAMVGGDHNLAVHVPLGMATFGVSIALVVWAWAPRRAV